MSDCPYLPKRPSSAGAKAHRRRGEAACEDCLASEREYRQTRRQGVPPERADIRETEGRPLEVNDKRMMCGGFGCLNFVGVRWELCAECLARGHRAPPWRGGPPLDFCIVVVEGAGVDEDGTEAEWTEVCGNLAVDDKRCAEHLGWDVYPEHMRWWSSE